MIETFILVISRNLSQNEYQKFLRLVSPEKRERIGRFHRFEDAQRTLLGDILNRLLINKYLNIRNSDMLFSTNEYGKPFLANHSEFHFNISHAGNYIAYAIDNKPIGIDIEEIKAIDLKIARRYFTEDEREYILSHPEMAQNEAFFKIWTMKESYIKRSGKGLSILLGSFSVFKESSKDACFYNNNHTP